MIKKIVFKVKKALKPYLKRLIVLVVVLFLAFILGAYKSAKVASLPDQNGWRTWTDDGSYGQISIYFNHSLSVTPNSIKEYNYKILKALQEAAIKEEGDELIYSYSAPGSVTLAHGSTTVDVKAMGVGGKFFYLHPARLVTGSYFDPENDMKDQVVIDEDTAWKLFGSNNIIGQAVYINGIPHYICGVVRRESGKIAKAAGLSEPVIFVSFQTLVLNGSVDSSSFDSSQIQTIEQGSEDSSSATDTGSTSSSDTSSGDTSGSSTSIGSVGPLSYGSRVGSKGQSIVSTNVNEVAGIACYELIMPDSVENYATSLVKEKLGFKDNADIVVLDSKTRFSFASLINVFRSFPSRSMQLTEFSYPYWENIARGWEDILAIIVVLELILFVAAFLLLVWIVVSWYNNRNWRTRDIVKKLNDKIYDFQSHQKRRKSNGKIKKTS